MSVFSSIKEVIYILENTLRNNCINKVQTNHVIILYKEYNTFYNFLSENTLCLIILIIKSRLYIIRIITISLRNPNCVSLTYALHLVWILVTPQRKFKIYQSTKNLMATIFVAGKYSGNASRKIRGRHAIVA